MNWATNKGLLQLADICTWDRVGNWAGWSLPDLPAHLHPQIFLLFSSLTGLTPLQTSHKDSWGWGFVGFYYLSKGSTAIQAPHCSSFSSAI